MKKTEQVREFWICPDTKESTDYEGITRYTWTEDAHHAGYIHVIEKSYADQLAKELEKQKEFRLAMQEVMNEQDKELEQVKGELVEEKQHVSEACAARDHWKKTHDENVKLKAELQAEREHGDKMAKVHKEYLEIYGDDGCCCESSHGEHKLCHLCNVGYTLEAHQKRRGIK